MGEFEVFVPPAARAAARQKPDKWIPTRGFDGNNDPAMDPEVQELAKVIAKVIHPSYKQTDHVFHRKAIATAVAVLYAGYRKVEP